MFAGNILAVDVGGTNVKILLNGESEQRRFHSGATLTPELMVQGVKELAKDWRAWELTACLAYLDLQDADTPRGPGGQLIGIRLPEFTFGVNWYLTDHVCLRGNYSCAIPEEPNTGTSVAHLFAMRLGVFW